MRTLIKVFIPAFALVMGLAACSESPISEDVSNGKLTQIANKPVDSIPPWDPQIAFTFGSGFNSQLWVMNSDGSHMARMFTFEDATDPSWSPTNFIAFYSTEYRILVTGEVTIDENGIPTWTNENYPASNDGGGDWKETNWCSVESTGLIAVVENPLYYATSGQHAVKAIPTTGGEILTYYTSPFDLAITDISWSPDDEKIAVLLTAAEGSDFTHSIVIVNTSTYEVTDSIPLSDPAKYLEWSRAGDINKLAFVMNDKIYYVSPNSGAIPQTDNASVFQPNGAGIAWSPDNSTILTTRASNGMPPSQSPHWPDPADCDLGTYNYSTKKWNNMVDFVHWSHFNWHR